nr:hypothetical protein [Tanacetum cinerariifolium]
PLRQSLAISATAAARQLPPPTDDARHATINTSTTDPHHHHHRGLHLTHRHLIHLGSAAAKPPPPLHSSYSELDGDIFS